MSQHPHKDPGDGLEDLSKAELICQVRELRQAAHALELFDQVNPPLLLGVSSTAAMLGLSASAVRQMVEHNTIPHFRLPSGRLRFSRDALERWAASRERRQG
jgi:excisionase family DNA binding protein